VISLSFAEWIKEFPGGITVANAEGIIVEMNERACKTFEKQGGRKLIGRNLLDVHNEPACSKVAQMLKTREANSYTIEKEGIKKLIYQTPWYKESEFAGLVELSLEISLEIPNFVRGK